ncbi:MAG: corrinoid protein [Candidatus Coatesbacteria bacterium]|nr:MAG: corrinoid protein [Candidatus Coatesbacteria bacterium]
MGILIEISESLQRGDFENVTALTERAVADGVSAKEILDAGLIAAMDTVGERFRKHEIFLPDVLLAAKAMYAGMDVLKPLLADADVPSRGKVVIGSVRGDLHDIGKNLVGIMLRGAGFDVIDLGNDVAPERFVDAAADEGAGVIGMSALLTTTMPAMKAVVELVEERGLSDDVKTIVGGAPVSADFAREIGADAYGFDAANAVVRVKELMDIS